MQKNMGGLQSSSVLARHFTSRTLHAKLLDAVTKQSWAS